MVEKAKRDVLGEWHLSNNREADKRCKLKKIFILIVMNSNKKLIHFAKNKAKINIYL